MSHSCRVSEYPLEDFGNSKQDHDPLLEETFEVEYFRKLRKKLENVKLKISLTSKKGELAHTIPLREEALSLHRDIWGVPSKEVSINAETLVLALNSAAVEKLGTGEVEAAHTLLLKAAGLIGPHSQMIPNRSRRLPLRALTLNNFGCLFKRTGKPRVSLSYLQKALEIEEMIETNVTNICKTRLNIASVKNDIGEHEEALKFISAAIFPLLQETYQTDNHFELDSFSPQKFKPLSDLPPPSGYAGVYNLLAVAYFNLGVVLECLGRFQESRKAYQRAESLTAMVKSGNQLADVLKNIQEANERPTTQWLCRNTVYGRDNRYKNLQRTDPHRCSRFSEKTGMCGKHEHGNSLPAHASSRAQQVAPIPSPGKYFLGNGLTVGRLRPSSSRRPSNNTLLSNPQLQNTNLRPKSAGSFRYRLYSVSPVGVAMQNRKREQSL